MEKALKPFRKEAYTLDALAEAGVPEGLLRMMLVDSRRAPQERARLSMTGRKRTEPTLDYAWGPDVNFLLGLDGGKQ